MVQKLPFSAITVDLGNVGGMAVTVCLLGDSVCDSVDPALTVPPLVMSHRAITSHSSVSQERETARWIMANP